MRLHFPVFKREDHGSVLQRRDLSSVSSLSQNSSISSTALSSSSSSQEGTSSQSSQSLITSSKTGTGSSASSAPSSTSSSEKSSSSLHASSAASSFSRIGGLTILSSSSSQPFSSQSPFYPSSHKSELPSLSITSSSTKSISSEASTASSSTPNYTDASSRLTSSSAPMSEVVATVTSTSSYAEYVTTVTYSYTQEYIITDSSTTFTDSVTTQTVVSFTASSGGVPSGVSSYSVSATPITTDLSYYQTVLQSHDSLSSTSKSSNTKKIIGGVVGGLLGLILAFLLLWFCVIRKRRRRRENGGNVDNENPFAGEQKRNYLFFGKFTKKNTSLEELNEKSIAYYGANGVVDNTGSGDGVTMLQKRSLSSNSSVSPLRPVLPPRRSSEDSLGLGGLSRNLLIDQQDHVTRNISIDTNATVVKRFGSESSYFSPSDQSDIINSNANSPTLPSRQMDILYEEETSDAGNTMDEAVSPSTPPSTDGYNSARSAHYKQSSRYNHIGLTPVPATNFKASATKKAVPPPIPKPRKTYTDSSHTKDIDIYDSLNSRRHNGQVSNSNLLDDESFNSSLLDMSSIDDLSSGSGGSD